MSINQENNYKTQDLALSAFLNLNFPILYLEKIDSSKFQFVFEDTVNLRNSIDSYYNNTGTVNPKYYFNSIKNLKSRFYSER